MDPIITPILTFGIGLARATIEFMRMRQENRSATEALYNQQQLAQMDHEFQLRLQEARLQHDVFLESIRSRNPDPTIAIVVESSKSAIPYMRIEVPDNIPNCLNTEAELLCDKGFDVIMDRVSEGYALALFIRTDLTVAFWLPLAYPQKPPTVFAITPSVLEQVHFDSDAWNPGRTLTEVVDALSTGY
ncbi:MAG TPA: hypothetical protein VJO32_01515 [Ktedonobacteraceae bacterium]|nr:hypothetical protein [Ktedonobacteraceae bacterium]